MIKFLYGIYWRICRRIGYRIVFMDYYDSKTFNLIKKNSHMALLKYVGKPDENGYIKVEEVWQIRIKKVSVEG